MDAVEQLIDEARKDARIKWAEVARRAGIDVQTLRRYRTGERRTEDTTRAIELAFGWPRGTIDAIASDEELPTIAPVQPEADDDRTSEWLELRDLAAELMRKIDTFQERDRRASS